MAFATATSELVSIKSKDSAACTRILTRWKSHILPTASTEEILQLFDCCQGKDSFLSTLFAIINDNDDLPFITTEGHRESSVEILRGILQHVFGHTKDCVEANSLEDRIDILQSLFQQCSRLFEKRMSRQDSSDHQGFHGSSLSSLEQSEHIRLSLVELMSELGSYLIMHTQSEELILEAASCICQTLAKNVFDDPFPDILAASCALVHTLAKLCPAVVAFNAKDLLLQLAGKDVKHCLFRNRRSKIRSEAVETSCAIVLCQTSQTPCKIDEQEDRSLPSSMLESLQYILLPGWEELAKMDASASVRVAALNATGMIAKQFDWTCSPCGEHRDALSSCKESDSSTELTAYVESSVLSLFVLGASDGNTEVQESAIQQMICSLNCGSQHEQGINIPWDVIAEYFPHMLELNLASFSLCQGRVRSLETLQVLLSFAIAILDSRVMTDCSLTLLSRMQPIVECLRKNIVSEEKDVLQVRNDVKIWCTFSAISSLTHSIYSHTIHSPGGSHCLFNSWWQWYMLLICIGYVGFV